MKQKKSLIMLAVLTLATTGFYSCTQTDNPAPYVAPPVVDPFDEGNMVLNGSCEGTNVANFFANDYIDGVKEGTTSARIVEDPADPTNHCIIVTSNDNPAQDWDSQFFVTIDEPLGVGDEVKFSMRVKADKVAVASSQAHAAPGAYLIYYMVGDVNFTEEWTTVEWTGKIDGSQDGMRTIAFNLSQNPKEATNYYFDDIRFELIKKAPIPVWKTLVVNGDCEGTDVTCLVGKDGDEGGAFNTKIVDGAGVDGSRAVVVTSHAGAAEGWDTQFFVTIDHVFQQGEQFLFRMKVRADDAASASTQAHTAPGAYKHWDMVGTINFTTEWQTFEKRGAISADQAGSNTVAINLNDNKELATKFYFDDIEFCIEELVDPE